MSIENELKMIPRERIEQEDILRLLRERGYKVEQDLKISSQEDTYYDDSNRTLLKNGCSFRIRRKVGKTVVTYKSPIDSDKDYKQREELETEIPEMYVQEDGSIHIEDAIDVLRKKYSDVNIPKDLQFAVKVINNRNKVNVHTEDGTVIELAFDHLHTENERGQDFSMKDEMECEVLSGNPEHLSELHRIISENYDVQINDLSKYARAMKEMQEQRDNMSLEETTVCAMLSYMIRSKEFEQLSYKGQVLHDYRVKIPENLSLENFKDPEYLIERISKVKRTKNYRPGKITSLEDMFLCFFSDMDYRDIEYKLVNFLNDNYYRGNTPITNRMLHSQQVMLITGLINKSKEITENDKKPLLCLTSALTHDIGHVPGAHTTERILGDLDGFFSHEINGRNVIERIVTDETANIVEAVKKHMASLGKECSDEQIREYIQINKTQIKKAIEAHSRTNSEKRGDGTVVQLPREADKICYCVSDIVDVLKKTSATNIDVQFFPQEWIDAMADDIGKGYERGEEVKQKIYTIIRMLNTDNFGQITTTIANTIRENVNDGRTYYDVDQDYWNIVNGMIQYVAGLREKGIIDTRKKQIQHASMYFVIKTFNENLELCDGNVEDAWDKALVSITQSNDLDILNCVNELKMIYENQPEKLREAFEEGGVLDTSKLRALDNADRQIKIQPKGRFQLSDLQPYLGEQWTTPPAKVIKDTYYNSQNGLSLCLREDVGGNQRQFIVKRKRDKVGVTQVERQKYVSESDSTTDLETLVTQFNGEYPDFHIQLQDTNPKCIIITIRTNAENEKGVTLRKDKSTIIKEGKRVDMPETIEILCRDRHEIKRVKKQLNEFLDIEGISLGEISTKETKEDQAMKILGEQQEIGVDK